MLTNRVAVSTGSATLAGSNGPSTDWRAWIKIEMAMDLESRRKNINRIFGNITFAIVLIAGLYIFATGSETLPENTRYLILAAVTLYAAIRLRSRFLRRKNHGAKRR